MTSNPIELFLAAGFFGAGKTTLLQNILTQTQGVRAGVIVNEFGRVSIDGRVLERNGLEMVEITNGSIFCACLKAKFVDALIEFSRHPIDVLFVENSGFADPSELQRLLKSLPLKRPYRYTGAVAVVDCTSFLDMLDLMPVVGNQVAAANRILLNKTDLATPEEVQAVRRAVQALNPSARVFETSYARVDLSALLDAPGAVDSGNTCLNTVSTRPMGFILRGQGEYAPQALLAFANAIGPALFRLKGFAPTPEGWAQLEYSGRLAELLPCPQPESTEGLTLVAIAANRSVLPELLAAAKTHLGDGVRVSVSGAAPKEAAEPGVHAKSLPGDASRKD